MLIRSATAFADSTIHALRISPTLLGTMLHIMSHTIGITAIGILGGT